MEHQELMKSTKAPVRFEKREVDGTSGIDEECGMAAPVRIEKREVDGTSGVDEECSMAAPVPFANRIVEKFAMAPVPMAGQMWPVSYTKREVDGTSEIYKECITGVPVRIEKRVVDGTSKIYEEWIMAKPVGFAERVVDGTSEIYEEWIMAKPVGFAETEDETSGTDEECRMAAPVPLEKRESGETSGICTEDIRGEPVRIEKRVVHGTSEIFEEWIMAKPVCCASKILSTAVRFDKREDGTSGIDEECRMAAPVPLEKREVGGTSGIDEECSMEGPVPLEKREEVVGPQGIDEKFGMATVPMATVPLATVRFGKSNRMEVGTNSDQHINDESHEVSLDIVEVAKSVRERLKIKYAFSKACCIYRVPERLRNLNEKAYTPRVVSLGPIHHGKKNLKAMEDHKKMYLQQFLKQCEVSVEDLINIIKENETELHDRYAETIQLSREDFATMILMDAVFIIMVLLNLKSLTEPHENASSDHIFFRPWKLGDVLLDMCLLENQLPFFILEKLFMRLRPQKYTIHELTSWFLKTQWVEWVKEDSNPSEFLHFVDFLRKCQQPTEGPSRPPAKQETLTAPTATEVHQAGVKFERDLNKNLLSRVTFDKGVLKIPQLEINDGTEILFRNLHAFEQCHHMYEGTFVSDYITFISCLVTAPNDVEILVREGILKNMLRSNEAVSNLLCNLDKENNISKDAFFSGVAEELNEYCKKRRHKWKAILKQVYFNNPWTVISVIAATVLLVLTVIQTVCSILQL